jgi:hypothetical protein
VTSERRVLAILDELLDELPTVAPDRLVAAVNEGVRSTTQRRTTRWGRLGWRPRIGRPLQVATGAAVAIVAALLVGLVWLSPRASSPGVGGVPSPSPTRSPRLPSLSPEVPLEIEGGQSLLSGALYTSARFEPRVTFRLGPRNDGDPPGSAADWCPDGVAPNTVKTSARTIALGHPKACLNELRLTRPFAVDCGTPDTHPDSDTLATAILGRPGLAEARDLGTLQTEGAVPTGLFAQDHPGRVIDIGQSPARPFDAAATDPDQCRLLPEPGSDDPVIEIRGDLDARLVLMDVGGELIVVRVADAGFDSATGVEAHSRGYGTGNPDQHEHLLEHIYDLQFH